MCKKRIAFYAIILFFWTALIAIMAILEISHINQEADFIARSEARSNFNKDKAFREWVSSRGGIYVFVDSTTQPNIGLSHIKERDIETPSGKKLTLMNAASLMRTLNEQFYESSGIYGHLTSKKLVCDKNEPDKWEEAALNRFERGVKEVVEYTSINNVKYLRLMQPMFTNESCLKCHAHQGYKVGDVRGGVSIAIPLNPILERADNRKKRSLYLIFFIWLVGFVGLTIAFKGMNKSYILLKNAKEELQENYSRLQYTEEKLKKTNEGLISTSESLMKSNKELEDANEKIQVGQRRYKLLSDLSNVGILIHKEDGVVLDVNNAICKVFNRDSKELIGRNIMQLLFSDEPLNKIKQKLEEKTQVPFLVKTFEKQDKDIWIELEMKNFIIKGEELCYTLVHDVTKKRMQEQELIKAKKKAEESEHLKTAFLNNMSHEIRTPMNGIIGFSSMIIKPEKTNEERRYYAETVIKCSHRLLHIVNDILDIAKIESGQIDIKDNEVQLDNFIADIAYFHHVEAKKKKLEIINSSISKHSIPVILDEKKVRQILDNLINNALKFTQKGTITINYRIINNKIEFSVADTGIGVPKKMHKKIFDRFRQAESVSEATFGGTGLGLSICKGLVEKMGGKIWIDSEPNEGTTFFFTIPYRTVNEQPKIEVLSLEKPLPNCSNQTILIAEDNDTNYFYIKEVLSDLNINIIRVENGKQAVETIKMQNSIDIIIMDIKMPVMNGYEATKLIKEIKPDLPIIALTAHALNKDREEALKAGCDDYIAKPIKPDQLTKVVGKYLTGACRL